MGDGGRRRGGEERYRFVEVFGVGEGSEIEREVGEVEVEKQFLVEVEDRASYYLVEVGRWSSRFPLRIGIRACLEKISIEFPALSQPVLVRQFQPHLLLSSHLLNLQLRTIFCLHRQSLCEVPFCSSVIFDLKFFIQSACLSVTVKQGDIAIRVFKLLTVLLTSILWDQCFLLPREAGPL